MPPNLGGFFMVRSYYPSECHADYFDFERIEALKPAIEACGISTLSQSPMLGFHKQMDNRIKLLAKLFGGGQKAASGGIQGDVLATDNNTVGMGDAGIKSAIQGSNVPNPDEAVPSFVSGAMAKAGKGLLEGTLQAGTSAVSDKLLDLVGLGG